MLIVMEMRDLLGLSGRSRIHGEMVRFKSWKRHFSMHSLWDDCVKRRALGIKHCGIVVCLFQVFKNSAQTRVKDTASSVEQLETLFH